MEEIYEPLEFPVSFDAIKKHGYSWSIVGNIFARLSTRIVRHRELRGWMSHDRNMLPMSEKDWQGWVWKAVGVVHNPLVVAGEFNLSEELDNVQMKVELLKVSTCPIPVIESFATDQSEEVRSALAEYQNLPVEVQHKLLQDDSDSVRKALVENPYVNDDVRMMAALGGA